MRRPFLLLSRKRWRLTPGCTLREQGRPENVEAAKQSLLKRAKANSDAQLGKYDPSIESADAGERTFEKGYVY